MKQRRDKNDVHCIGWGLEVANVLIFLCTIKKDEEL